MGSRASRNPAQPPAHLRDRVRLLQRRLHDSGADALLVVNPIDIRYLTGFVGDDSWALVPVRGSTRVTLLSDFRFEEQIQREAPHARVIMRKKGLVDELKQLIDHQKSIEKIALQPAHTTLALRKKLVKELGAKHLVEVDEKLVEQRARKTDDEVKAIRAALKIQQQAFRETLAFMEPGQSEFEVCAYLEYRMRALGADGPSFPTIIAADANASLPHAIPGKDKLRKKGIVLIDWGARAGGYCSDLTRVVGLGGMPAKVREIYQVVLDAQLAAIDAIAPGKTLAEIDAVARDHIEQAGYGERFGHSLGHGIGLNIHEEPRLAKTAEGVLEVGHVITVEPGIYLPGVGGVRIEDDVLVTARGHEVLSDLPKTLEDAII